MVTFHNVPVAFLVAFGVITVSCSALPYAEDDDALDRPKGFQVALPVSKPLGPLEIHNRKSKISKTTKRPVVVKVNKESTSTGLTKNTVSLEPDYLYLEKDTLFDNLYKPWGAAALPKPPTQIILDKVDDELFTTDSEIHRYDQRVHKP